MYLHCHTKGCHWQQDDFYSVKGYNPISYMQQFLEDLLKDPDRVIKTDDGNITAREMFARDLENYAKRIRNMPWMTVEHWEKEKKDAVCPNCGEQNWDID